MRAQPREGGGEGEHFRPGPPPTTGFRHVSACSRCRRRKNRCDQTVPRCSNCAKANVRCVGFDPVSKREIPRSYVGYLETRVQKLEALLAARNIACPPPRDDFAIADAARPAITAPGTFAAAPPAAAADTPAPSAPASASASASAPASASASPSPDSPLAFDPALHDHHDDDHHHPAHHHHDHHPHHPGAKLGTRVGGAAVPGSPHSRVSSVPAGLSFARVVFAAVKQSTSTTHAPTAADQAACTKPFAAARDAAAAGAATTMRDSFFGLHTRPAIKPAPFPPKELGARLADLYFEHANPQIPVLHRGEFMSLFERVYGADAKERTPRELYLLNIVFAIGSGIIVDSSSVPHTGAAAAHAAHHPAPPSTTAPPSKKRQKLSAPPHQPEHYHSSAIIHLESFLTSPPAAEAVGGGLEELQAVLLLAGLALLRPVAPGLWYIIGVAVRLSVDLGLHFEDIDADLDSRATHPDVDVSRQHLGRKQWTRDLRRRLWWCVFNLDRLVSSCVGRPVAVSEAVVTTEFPSLLDDKYITPSGFLQPPAAVEVPSYKLVSRQYIRLRLLQSEILQVLQHRQAESARTMGANADNTFIPTRLESPFVTHFSSFRHWRVDIDHRLLQWKESAPQRWDTGVGFNPLFLELNYWQAVIMLYRQSLSVPEQLAGELSPATGDDVQSPGNVNFEHEDDEQMVFIKVAEAGQMVLRIYRQLHRLKLVNYTFLATHHLFMSGISFLYAIWHSTLVRSQMTIDDVDFTVLAATSVLSDLIPVCPPAESCRDAFVRMSKATVSMVMSTTGFGHRSTLGTQPPSLSKPEAYRAHRNTVTTTATKQQQVTPPRPARRSLPKFDMNLKDLFSDEELASRPPPTQPHKLQAFAQGGVQGAPAPYQNSHPWPEHHASPPSPHHPTSAAPPQPYAPPTEPAVPQLVQPGYSLDHLDFLTDFTLATDPGGTTQMWGGPANHHLDQLGLGGGANGAAAAFDDGSGAWGANADMFDTFFFGTGGSGNGY